MSPNIQFYNETLDVDWSYLMCPVPLEHRCPSSSGEKATLKTSCENALDRNIIFSCKKKTQLKDLLIGNISPRISSQVYYHSQDKEILYPISHTRVKIN